VVAIVAPSVSVSYALTLFLQIEMLDHLFAVIEELPVFGVMIGVHKGKDYAVHVARVGSAEIGSVQEVKGDGLAVRRCGRRHAGLVAGFTVVSEEQAVAVHVDHADHVFAVALHFHLNFAQEGRSRRRWGDTKSV
jgi:hypothetical protein